MLRNSILAASIALLVADAGVAQCTPTFGALAGLRGFDAAVHTSLRWDPDGAGPLTERLVLGGDFRMVGSTSANGIVAWDPATGSWTPFGSGMLSVKALAVLPNGQLVAGGSFATAGGVPANSIARWTGSTWAPLGPGLDADVLALCVHQNGDLIAGGGFSFSGTVPISSIARWNGTAWSAMGSGTNAAVQALATSANGDVIAGGWFTLIGGVPANRLARWNGSTWSEYAGGIGGEVRMLRQLANGDLLAGGQFGNAGAVAAQNIARWNGTAWSPLGGGINAGWYAYVRCAMELANGDLIVGGSFDTTMGGPGNYIARWNGSTWTPLGSGFVGAASPIETLTITALADGSIVAGGRFLTAGGTKVNHAARWNGTDWSPMQTGMDNFVVGSVALPDGDIVFCGTFTTIGSQTVNHIARWDGTTFHALGTGLSGPAVDLVVDGNGDLVVVGHFTSAGGIATQSVARWNGSTWSAMDQGIDLPYGVTAIARTTNGDLWCAGYPHTNSTLSRWNGTAWTPVTNGPNQWVSDLASLPDGDLVATGNFTAVGTVAANYIARFDGSQWHALGSGFDWLGRSLHVTRDGSLIALGYFAVAGGVASRSIARWNGVAWQGLAGGLGSTPSGAADGHVACELPNGDLLVGGRFGTAGGVAARSLARWNGSTWTAVANADNDVDALTARRDGSVFVGGKFLTLGSVVAPYLAQLTSPCAATATSLGGGCPSSGGANTLVARTLPWTGSTFTSDASGLPAAALVVAVTGLSAVSLPLPSLLPTGQSGCTLLASPDLTTLLIVNGGTATSSFALPNQPSLAGIGLRHQMVPLEVLPGAAPGAATATNVLSLTVGAF